MENQHAKLSKTLENIQKIFSVAEIIAIELVALNTHFYRQRILVIQSQYVNKQSEDLRYTKERLFRTEILSE